MTAAYEFSIDDLDTVGAGGAAGDFAVGFVGTGAVIIGVTLAPALSAAFAVGFLAGYAYNEWF